MGTVVTIGFAVAYIMVSQTSSFSFINLFQSYEGIDYNTVEITDGTYTGYGTGFRGAEVEVLVEVINSTISSITIENCGCTGNNGPLDYMQEGVNMSDLVVETQTTAIDGISGATKSTEGILEAVEDALG